MEGNHRAFRRKPEKRIRFRLDVQPCCRFYVQFTLAASKHPASSEQVSRRVGLQEALPLPTDPISYRNGALCLLDVFPNFRAGRVS